MLTLTYPTFSDITSANSNLEVKLFTGVVALLDQTWIVCLGIQRNFSVAWENLWYIKNFSLRNPDSFKMLYLENHPLLEAQQGLISKVFTRSFCSYEDSASNSDSDDLQTKKRKGAFWSKDPLHSWCSAGTQESRCSCVLNFSGHPCCSTSATLDYFMHVALVHFCYALAFLICRASDT